MEVAHADVVRVAHASAVTEVRRLVSGHVTALGWNDDAGGTASLVATELATNLAKHARDGVLVVNRNVAGEKSAGCLQLVAVDRGPGISDLARCLRDGFSTTGSPGTGLGAVRRMSNAFDIVSTPGKGTLVFAELMPDATAARRGSCPLAMGAISVPREGESVCGDSWAARVQGNLVVAMVCDGLGHGPIAAEAARLAVETFHSSVVLEPQALMELAHAALRPTRGAALAFAAIDTEARQLRYCGVGNINAVVVSPDSSRHLVSHNGIVGHRATRIATFSADWPQDARLVMHSDGVSARWRREEWPGMWLRAPALLASVIWRDHGRGTDDATVLVVAGR